MRPGIIEYKPVRSPTLRPDRGAIAFVWSTWLVLLGAALVFLVKYPRNIPFSEDWLLVPPLTGHEANLLDWLWTQNNEHRIPFPRLILLALMNAAHGDFRAGMLFNVLILGILACAMIIVARRVRGGQTSYADAFFPIALLHLGNWENMFWSWQLTQVVPTVLACVILLTLVGSQPLTTPVAAIAAGLSLILLPLSGANGLIFVPILAPWIGYCGFRHWRATKAQGQSRWVGLSLIAAAAIAIALAGLYFVGYKNPPHGAPNPGLGASLAATVKFLALSIGPAARSSWSLSTIVTLSIIVTSAIVVILATLRRRDAARYRALGMLVFYAGLGLFALAMGWGRARVLPLWGGIWPTRYVLLSVPVLLTAYFIWEIYGPRQYRAVVQYGLCLGMLLLIPFNTIHGYWWYRWYLAGVGPFEHDLQMGMSASQLVGRNQGFLLTWMNPDGDKLRMLREAKIGLFAGMGQDPVTSEVAPASTPTAQPQTQAQSEGGDASAPLLTHEIRYTMPEASTVTLVWGINGWRIVPEELRPAGTEVKDNVMRTPMIQERGSFVAKLWVPADIPVDYCFLITDRRGLLNIVYPVCDGNYRDIASTSDAIEVHGKVTLNKDLSDVLAKRYFFLAGGAILVITWLVFCSIIHLLDSTRALAIDSARLGLPGAKDQ
jgi:hypothetical protein